MHQYRRRVARRLALALAASLLTAAPGTAAAAVDDPPTLGTPTIAATSSASVSVTVSVDSHNSDTTVQVEYVTAGAYRAHRVPGPATTVTIGTTPASDAGPVVVTGQVTGLAPGSTYRMRVKAVNAGGETTSAEVNVSTPKAPKIAFRAKVGPHTTKLTKLVVSGLVGVGPETLKIKCKTLAKGCPFTAETDSGVPAGTVKLTPRFKNHPLKPGAKVRILVLAANSKVASLTLTMRDGKQPKVTRS